MSAIYKQLGVETIFEDEKITLTKTNTALPVCLELDLVNAPDIAQTIAVTCFGLGISCNLSGLHTLKIKETDRLVALQNEIQKFGGTVHITENRLQLETFTSDYLENVKVATYHDHRMAMAFAPLGLKVGFTITDADVVSKSYPDFWKDMHTLGLQF